MRDDGFEWRLNNWAKWRLRNDTLSNGYTSVNFDNFGMGDAPRDVFERQLIHIIDTDATEIDEAVKQLESTLRRTVEVFYMHGGGVEKRAKQLACGVATMYERLGRAKRQIKASLTDAAQCRQQERDRVEAQQRNRIA